MRRLLAIPLAILSACAPAPFGQVAPAPPDRIVIEPLRVGSLDSLRVTYDLLGSATGATTLSFPENWGPEGDLVGLRSGLTAVDCDGVRPVVLTHDGATVILRHREGARLEVSYVIAQDYRGEPRWEDHRVPGMRPVLQPDYATVIGATVFPAVAPHADGTERRFRMAFEGLPDGAALALSQPLYGGTTRPLRQDEISGAVLTLGAFRYAETEAGGLTVRTAVRGTWALTDAEVAAAARAVVARAGRAFGDQPFRQYFVALSSMPSLPGGGSTVIGTGLTESFFVLATPNASAERLRHVIVHEVLHEWITRRMGTTDEVTDPTRMWFTEGLTEYFTQRVLLEDGLISLDEFVRGFDDLAVAYQTSPVQTATNAEVLEGVWGSREMERLPYQRGALLALHWDTLLRREGRAPLTSVVATLVDRAAAVRSAGGTAVLTDEAIRAAMTDALGGRFARDFAAVIERGGVLSLSELALPSCLAVLPDADGLERLSVRPGTERNACIAEVAR